MHGFSRKKHERKATNTCVTLPLSDNVTMSLRKDIPIPAFLKSSLSTSLVCVKSVLEGASGEGAR